MQSLGKLLSRLIDSNIDFVLIGGFAGVVHGSTIVTRDLDICAAVNPDQIDALRKCLKDLNPKHRIPPLKPSFLELPIDVAGTRNIYLITDLGVLDVVSEVTGVGDYARVAAAADEITIFGKKCKIISVEDLIASKKMLGRQKDFVVVDELEKMKKSRA